MFDADQLIDRGILDPLPHSYSPSQFCMALVSQFLGGRADLGATLLRVDSRGTWQVLGGFLELYELGERIHNQRAMAFPVLMNAIREGFAKSTFEEEAWDALEPRLTGSMGVAGLSRPELGVLILGFGEETHLPSTSLRLLAYVTETYLSRGDFASAQTGPVTQVNGDNSTVIFTGRQMQVLKLLAEGKTNSEIGKVLSISASLAKQEVAFLAHALQVKSRLEVVVQAQRQGILVADLNT